MICLNCKKLISDKAKYCSDKCRMAYIRANKTQPEHQPEHEQTTRTEQPEQLTRTYKPLEYPEHLKTYTDHCNFCNHKFGKASDGEQLLGWICADCISKEMKANEAVD